LPCKTHSAHVSEFIGIRTQVLELVGAHDDRDRPVSRSQEHRRLASLVDEGRERSASLGNRDFGHLPILGGRVTARDSTLMLVVLSVVAAMLGTT